jgi:hypothetical protein
MLLLLSVLTSTARQGFGPSPFEACNFGPTHHSHLVLPLALTVTECKDRGANFVMSHGAAFFCPHTYDVKLLATIAEDDARATLCETYGAQTDFCTRGCHWFPSLFA